MSYPARAQQLVNIYCYNPTNVTEETYLIAFYNDLSSFVCCIPKHNVLVIDGDTNAQIGKNVNKFSLHNSSNRNGEDNAKAQINYILINKKWNNSALNCEAYSSFDGESSDDRIVTLKIRLSLRRSAARTTTTVHYDWSLLNNWDIRDNYTLIRKKYSMHFRKYEKHLLRMTNMRT